MRRLLIALAISVLGIVMSWIFLRPQEWQTDTVNTKQSVAVVTNISNDVSRQEEGRLMWSPIRKGDKIFAGDKIKTSGLSSTTIQFSDSKSTLDIEENSIVVVTLDQNKFSLNMLEGRVFIQGEDAKNQLNLLSAGKKINYAGNTAVSVDESGQSKVESFNEGSIFKDLSPSYSQNILSARSEVEIKWKPEPKPGAVNVFVGESPLLLKKSTDTDVLFETGKISAPMKPGLNYWQLSWTENGQELKSPLMKLNLIRPLPPTQIFPVNKEVVSGNDKPFDFKWNKGSSSGLTFIEVSRDPEMKSPVLKEEVRDQTFYTPSKILTEGDYYWRISFDLPNGEKVESPITSFTVHRGGGILSPAPLMPMENARFYLSSANETSVKFEWKRQDNVTYTLRITSENFNKEIESSANSATVSLNRSGSYRWEVYSRTRDGKTSVLPSQRSFEVRPEGKISWTMNQKVFNYLDNLPVIILRWQKNYPAGGIVRISKFPDMRDPEVFNVQGKDFPFRPSEDGTYFARISGLDENQIVSASSDLFEFEVKAAPIPPAPIAKTDSKKLLASSSGEFMVSMTNQKSSWLLVAQLVDGKGGILDERRFSDNNIRFAGLLPGKYIVRTNFQDEYNRKGEVSVLELEVPLKSKIPAPKLKGIKIR